MTSSLGAGDLHVVNRWRRGPDGVVPMLNNLHVRKSFLKSTSRTSRWRRRRSQRADGRLAAAVHRASGRRAATPTMRRLLTFHCGGKAYDRHQKRRRSSSARTSGLESEVAALVRYGAPVDRGNRSTSKPHACFGRCAGPELRGRRRRRRPRGAVSSIELITILRNHLDIDVDNKAAKCRNCIGWPRRRTGARTTTLR